jgi:hypothetical protein
MPNPVTYVLEVGVKLVRNGVDVKLDANGRGWTEIPVAFDHVVSIQINGADPRHGGYIPVPTPSANSDSTNTQIEIIGGPANGTVRVFYWVVA